MEIEKAIEAPRMELKCPCGANVQLMWKAGTGEESLFWFEEAAEKSFELPYLSEFK